MKISIDRTSMAPAHSLDVDPPTLMQLDCSLYPREKPVYHCSLTRTTITCIPLIEGNIAKKTITANLNDVIGCDCFKGKRVEDLKAYLTIYAYPHKKKFVSKKTSRIRQTLTLTFENHATYKDNLREADRWRIAITALLRGIALQNSQGLEHLQLPCAKQMLVLVNPFSGPGKALQIFQQRIIPIFAEAGIHYSTVVTERAGHASDICKTLDLEQWYGIIIVSGDGLIFEVINGLMERSDWEKAIKTPIGALPGGSGNALCCSLNYMAKEPYMENFPLHSSFVIAKHSIKPMDLVAVDTCDGKRCYSFLSITWALIADIDIESERYRALGSARFTVEALARIINMRQYRGRISYLPMDPNAPRPVARRPALTRPTSLHADLADRGNSQLHQLDRAPTRSVSVMQFPRSRSQSEPPTPTTPSGCEPWAAEGGIAGIQENGGGPDADSGLERVEGEANGGQDGAAHMGAGPSTNGTPASDPSAAGEYEATEQSAPGTGQSDAAAGGSLDTSSSRGQVNGDLASGCSEITRGSGVRASRHHVPTEHLVPLDDDVPSDWVVLEDDFLYVTAYYLSLLGPGTLIGPDCKLDEGCIHLSMIRTGVSRSRLLGILMAQEDAGHINMPEVETIKVKAFRIEPLNERGGHMVVDGEEVKYGPIQAQVLPSVARVMALEK